MFLPPVEKCNLWSLIFLLKKSLRFNRFLCRRCWLRYLSATFGFCLTEHSQNSLSCSSDASDSLTKNTQETQSLICPLLFSPWQVKSNCITPQSWAASFNFTKLGRAREREGGRWLKMERAAGKDEWVVKRRRFYSEIGSYIKRDGGRGKIRGLEGKAVRQVLKQGTLNQIENDSDTVMRWGEPAGRGCVGWESREGGLRGIISVKKTMLFYLNIYCEWQPFESKSPKTNSLFSSFFWVYEAGFDTEWPLTQRWWQADLQQ